MNTQTWVYLQPWLRATHQKLWTIRSCSRLGSVFLLSQIGRTMDRGCLIRCQEVKTLLRLEWTLRSQCTLKGVQRSALLVLGKTKPWACRSWVRSSRLTYHRKEMADIMEAQRRPQVERCLVSATSVTSLSMRHSLTVMLVTLITTRTWI